MSDSTINYYDENATAFIDSTMHADMSTQYASFLRHIEPSAYILDLGCGSGRDSKFFLDHGFGVEAVDGSSELCIIASEFLGKPVRHLILGYLTQFGPVLRYCIFGKTNCHIYLKKSAMP